MSCWEGAEGGGSRPQCHQSESELYRDFLFNEGKAEGYPGPKFRSLRHLRQVNIGVPFSLPHHEHFHF